MHTNTAEGFPTRHRFPYRNQSGYSIAEVVAALGIAAVLSSIAAPNLASLSAQYQLTSAANQLAFDLSRTRMKAVGQNVFCRVKLANNDSGSVYWVERSNDGTTYTLDGTVTTLPSQISFAELPEVMPRFDRRGLTPGTAVIKLKSPADRTKTVTVNVLGRVTVQ